MAGPSNPISEEEASRIATYCIAAASDKSKLHLRNQLIALEDERSGDDQLKLALTELLYKSTIPIETHLNMMGFTSAGSMSSSEAAQQVAAVKKSASDISATPRRREATTQHAPAAPKKGPQYRLHVPALDVSQARQNVGTFGILSPFTTRQPSVQQDAMLLQQVPPHQPPRRQKNLETFSSIHPTPPKTRKPSTTIPTLPPQQTPPPPHPLPTTPILPSPHPPIPPSTQELAARHHLRHGIPMSLALTNHNKICPSHLHHLSALLHEAEKGSPDPASWDSLMPFYDSITYDTALFPVCRDCAVATGAVNTTGTTGLDALVVRRVDTCTCASRIIYGRPPSGFQQVEEEGRHCLHCEQRSIEDAKAQARMARQVRHADSGEPVVTGERGWAVLKCACGKHCFVRDVVRRCVGCGGVRTAPYSNFRGDEIAFAAGTVDVETLVWAGAEFEDDNQPITLPELVEFHRTRAIAERIGQAPTPAPAPAIQGPVVAAAAPPPPPNQSS